jgi:putative pyruvate formate lyase activating enzyme
MRLMIRGTRRTALGYADLSDANLVDADLEAADLYRECAGLRNSCCKGLKECTYATRAENYMSEVLSQFTREPHTPARYTHLSAANIRARAEMCPGREHALIADYSLAHNQEACLRGTGGLGTIQFGQCDLKCDYCIISKVSIKGQGYVVSDELLADLMLDLQFEKGAHFIGLFSPTIQMRPFLRALALAKERGLTLPLVYNTAGQDSPELLRQLDGVVDVYVPDMKYSDDRLAKKYSKVSHYVSRNRVAVREMHRQVGDLRINAGGLAEGGLIVRILVLPDDIAGVAETARFLSEHISGNTFVNLMGGYEPVYKAPNIPELNRNVTEQEVDDAHSMLQSAGLQRVDVDKGCFY